MLDINLIRNNPEKVKKALLKRMTDVSFEDFNKKDKQKRLLMVEADELKAKRNRVSKEIPVLKKAGEDILEKIAAMKKLGEEVVKLDDKIKALDKELFDFVAGLPNMPDDDIVAGDKEANVVVNTFGEKPKFDFEPKNHVDLCESLKLIDYKRAAKIAGSGNWMYTGVGARLEWALINFFIDEHIKDGYEFTLVPHMLNKSAGFGAGQFPKFNDDVFWLKEGNEEPTKFLLPTSETAMVNIHAGEALTEDILPLKYCAFSPCYRREAGSYRAEERGMIRGHQFNKVEMIQFIKPENWRKAFDEMVGKAEKLVQKLGLHYQLSKLAASDVSASMARTYDIEIWIPSMGIYKEVSSVSNAKDYQSRRNNTKFRNKETGKLEFVYALNGSGLATPRVFPAIIEQFQQADGSIKVPEVLVKYLGMEYIK
jgi:seryl-tRNA synthetase